MIRKQQIKHTKTTEKLRCSLEMVRPEGEEIRAELTRNVAGAFREMTNARNSKCDDNVRSQVETDCQKYQIKENQREAQTTSNHHVEEKWMKSCATTSLRFEWKCYFIFFYASNGFGN